MSLNKNFYRNFIVILVIVVIFAGFIYYICDLQEQLDNVVTEKIVVSNTLNETTEALEDIKAELDDTSNKLDQAYNEIQRQSEEIDTYKRVIEDEEAKWRQRYEEYPVATEAWIAMKTFGWSDIVCAGIMGNLMAETGGSGTLHLEPLINGSSGYGLVQWLDGRRSVIKSRYGSYPSVKEQMQYVYDELYGTNGIRSQVTNKQLDAIMNAETPEECAYAFACYYERCAYSYRYMRRGFARKAYEYFVC